MTQQPNISPVDVREDNDELFRTARWEDTALGPPNTWPASLHTVKRIIKNAHRPIFAAWGPDNSLLFNHAFSKLLEDSYAPELGHSMREVFEELVDVDELLARIYEGHSVEIHDLQFSNGPDDEQEPKRYRCSCSPLLDDHEEIAGLMATYFISEPSPQADDDPQSARFAEYSDDDRRLVGIARDVTERMRTERRLEVMTAQSKRRKRLYEAILSNTPDLLFVYDTDYQVQYANEALLDLWGVSLEEVEGRRLADLDFESWHAEIHEREIDTIIDTHQPVRGEVPLQKSGRRKVYDYLMVPIIDEEDRVEAVAGITRDITERKQAEEAQRLAGKRKNRFLAVLSHELRNPLAPIKLSLHLMEQAEPGSDRERRARDVIARQIDQLTRLVDDLLDVTRVTRNIIELQREPLELNSLAEATIEDHCPLLEAKSTALTFHPAPCPITVDGDRNRLAQMLGNLLQNSAKFTSDDGEVTVSIEGDTDADQAIIRVADNGIGIPSEIMSTLFEPFSQNEPPLDHSDSGLGLGLALVKGITDLHGGTIDVHSGGKAQGTEFTIRLPAEIGTTESPSPSPKESTVSQLHLLIIEDNPDVADTMRSVLELKGHDVSVAHDGPAGIEKAQDCSPDVILCDIGLPEMDGYTLARTIRRDPQLESTPLIALSGYASPEDMEKSKAAGFDHHMAKPPDLEELDQLLSDAASN